MSRQTKIIKDKKQTRTTIPASIVKEKDIKSGDIMEWSIINKKVIGEVKNDR